MDWQEQLISLYLFVCNHYQTHLSNYCERMSTFSDLSFSDAEAITLYLYGVIEGCRTIKSIHCYAAKHLKEWFPKLPKYAAYDHRLNQLSDVFIPLLEHICNTWDVLNTSPNLTGLIDAMPIIMAQRGRRFHAKVAPELATKNGYCATKKLHYYGVKLHVVATKVTGILPRPACIGLTNAGLHDRKAFEQISSSIPKQMNQYFADKAYQVEAKPIHLEATTTLYTPVKKEKGQDIIDAADQLLSTAVSRVRQPIKSLFS